MKIKKNPYLEINTGINIESNKIKVPHLDNAAGEYGKKKESDEINPIIKLVVIAFCCALFVLLYFVFQHVKLNYSDKEDSHVQKRSKIIRTSRKGIN